MNKKWTRRETIQALGWISLSAPLLSNRSVEIQSGRIFTIGYISGDKPSRQIRCIILGAGNRGSVYASYSLRYPEEMKVVGVAEPVAFRREKMGTRYHIEIPRQFNSWEQVFEVEKFADAVIISTPDHLHFAPAMAALEKGYAVLLEKPMSQTWNECLKIREIVEKNKNVTATGHVLRYAPYYLKLKDLIDQGTIGRILSIQHMEPVFYEHMAHSYVRGNWRNERESNPILINKSCHDLDLLHWWTGKPCSEISSFGHLSVFKKENAPGGSTLKCLEGCKVERSCPFSAIRIYLDGRRYLHHFDLPDSDKEHEQIIRQYLGKGDYGRCVFHCDNDVMDHQVVNMRFGEDITATFNLEGLSGYTGRRTRIMGSTGQLDGDENEIRIYNFSNGEMTLWQLDEKLKNDSGHGGGDFGLLAGFLLAVDRNNPELVSTRIENSMESHKMAFRAEESRKDHQVKIVQNTKE